MNSFPTLESLGFPARRSNYRALWAPIFLEPMIGSGERFCIGVVASDDTSGIVRGVDGLERLICIYGDEANAFVYASQVALHSIQRKLNDGIRSLVDWNGSMEGLTFGPVRSGAGEDLEDIARSGLLQCASLLVHVSSTIVSIGDNVIPFSESDTTLRRLETLVRDTVIARRSDLTKSFNQLYRISDKARATRIGFVGTRLTANFGLLMPGRIEPLVNQAKARLWDLTHVKSGAIADLLPQANREFELLLYRASEQDPRYSDRQLSQVAAAVCELEEEADKASIRCRPMYTTMEIADFLLRQEAA